MTKKLIYILAAVILFIAGFFIAKNELPEEPEIKRTQIMLGTVVEITLRDVEKNNAGRIFDLTFNEFKRIDSIFSTYRNSPVTEINNNRDSVIKIDGEIFNLLVISEKLWKLTSGGFDVSLQPLIDAWGFETDSPAIPDKKSLEQALKHSGWKNVRLLNDNFINKNSGAGFNFGSVAKGYAVDRATEILKNHQIENALINAGGDIRTIGGEWTIGISDPVAPSKTIFNLRLTGKSVATSGDYEQYFEKDGVRYHHILSPQTGYPANQCRSVTIITNDCTTADALATGVFVLGPEKGILLVNQLPETEAIIIDFNGRILMSENLTKYLIKP